MAENSEQLSKNVVK